MQRIYKKINTLAIHLRNLVFFILNSSFITICRFLMVNKKKVVFSNFNGQGYGDNPKYIANEIIRQNLPYDLVWLVNDLSDPMPKCIRKVLFNSRRARYELSTAKIIINNVKNGLPYHKKNCQYYIQTWHGGFPLKYIEGEIKEDRLSPYLAKSKDNSSITNLLLASCQLDYEVMSNSFFYNGEIFKFGIPRNDLLFNDKIEIKKKVKNTMSISEKKKIILYAPTFRDDNGIEAYNIDSRKVIEEIEYKTGQEWVLIFRLHPNVKQFENEFSYSDKIINGSSYPDPQELEVASDILITDYSSMIYDFAIMKKPIFLYATDIAKYKKERGLRQVYFSLPFSLCLNNEQLIKAISKFDMKEYLDTLHSFVVNKLHSYDTGHASEAIVNRIKNVINNEFTIN